MKNFKFLLPIVALTLILVSSCEGDDDPEDNFIPARDRAEENIDSTLEVERYLNTHFITMRSLKIRQRGSILK